MAWRDIELTIDQNDEFSLVIEEISGERNLARPAYEQAEIAVKSIIEMARKAKRSIHSAPEKGQALTLAQEKYYGYGGNVIAFCAERGQGKTSVMLTVAESLKNYPNAVSGMDTNALKDARFSVMSPIDPTLLERSSGSERPNFAGIVLSYLHRELVRFLRDGASDRADSEAQKRELFSKIKKCDNWFRASRTEKSDSSLEGLYETEYSLEVKQYINDIISSYLGYKLGQNRGLEDGYLVIPVDDTDLNFSNAYSILEDIRRYFTLPNVIVLMAVERTQLLKILTAHFYDEMRVAGQMKLFTEKEAYRMAAKYLDKLIPASQTVSLPTVRSETENRNRICIREQDNEDPKELQEYLFRTIYEKTGIVFTIHENYLHNLIPTTLRGIRHLIRLLREMKDCEQPRTPLPDYEAKPNDPSELEKYTSDLKKYASERKKWSEDLLWNLDRFEAYFLGDWCDSKLDMDAQEAVKRVSTAEFGILIPTAWKRVRNYIEKRGEDDSAYTPGEKVKQILGKFDPKPKDTSNSNDSDQQGDKKEKKEEEKENTTPTYLDLRELLDAYRDDQLRESIFRFVFAMQTCLSMRLIRRALVNHIQKLGEFITPSAKENEPKLATIFEDSELAEVLKGGVLVFNDKTHLIKLESSVGLLSDGDLATLTNAFSTRTVTGSNNHTELHIFPAFNYLLGLKAEKDKGSIENLNDAWLLFDGCTLVCCNIELQEQIEKWYKASWQNDSSQMQASSLDEIVQKLNEALHQKVNYLPDEVFGVGTSAPLHYIAKMKEGFAAYLRTNSADIIYENISYLAAKYTDYFTNWLNPSTAPSDPKMLSERISDLELIRNSFSSEVGAISHQALMSQEEWKRIFDALNTVKKYTEADSSQVIFELISKFLGISTTEQSQ